MAASVGNGLICVGAIFWVGEFFRQICQENGLADLHFGWPKPFLASIRHNWGLFALVALPLGFIVVATASYSSGEYHGSIGRAAFLAGMLALSIFTHKVVSGRSLQQFALSGENPDWSRRVHLSFYVIGVTVPIVMAALAISGYFYSASQLSIRLLLSLSLVASLFVSRALAERWLKVREHNREASHRADARLADTVVNQRTEDDEMESLNLHMTNRENEETQVQLHYLLKHAVIFGLFIGGWMIWADVLPALQVFDKAELWKNRIEVAERIEVNGKETVQTSEKIIPTTLKHLIFALVVVAGTMVISKSLPALLRITLLERMTMDRGGRHAVAIIFRYLISLCGVIIACRLMSITWGSVQWLAAAMTVGLGFGLQEVFANFVSGIIILFERPIRVGDTVTVNGVTGTVSRMQIRATTITDLDRRELVVPNKKFITEDVINWTLSDPISRVTVAVGVAYGTETRRVRRILLDVAKRHPMVLQTPEPSALFWSFGESTLDFELRVFIPRREVWPAVVNELNLAINEEFKKNDIEIAFPQRDLNIRNIHEITSFGDPRQARESDSGPSSEAA